MKLFIFIVLLVASIQEDVPEDLITNYKDFLQIAQFKTVFSEFKDKVKDLSLDQNLNIYPNLQMMGGVKFDYYSQNPNSSIQISTSESLLKVSLCNSVHGFFDQQNPNYYLFGITPDSYCYLTINYVSLALQTNDMNDELYEYDGTVDSYQSQDAQQNKFQCEQNSNSHEEGGYSFNGYFFSVGDLTLTLVKQEDYQHATFPSDIYCQSVPVIQSGSLDEDKSSPYIALVTQRLDSEKQTKMLEIVSKQIKKALNSALAIDGVVLQPVSKVYPKVYQSKTSQSKPGLIAVIVVCSVYQTIIFLTVLYAYIKRKSK